MRGGIVSHRHSISGMLVKLGVTQIVLFLQVTWSVLEVCECVTHG